MVVIVVVDGVGIIFLSGFKNLMCIKKKEDDVPLVEFMYLVFTRMPVRVTVGDSGLRCCTCVTSFER